MDREERRIYTERKIALQGAYNQILARVMKYSTEAMKARIDAKIAQLQADNMKKTEDGNTAFVGGQWTEDLNETLKETYFHKDDKWTVEEKERYLDFKRNWNRRYNEAGDAEASANVLIVELAGLQDKLDELRREKEAEAKRDEANRTDALRRAREARNAKQ